MCGFCYCQLTYLQSDCIPYVWKLFEWWILWQIIASQKFNIMNVYQHCKLNYGFLRIFSSFFYCENHLFEPFAKISCLESLLWYKQKNLCRWACVQIRSYHLNTVLAQANCFLKLLIKREWHMFCLEHWLCEIWDGKSHLFFLTILKHP